MRQAAVLLSVLVAVLLAGPGRPAPAIAQDASRPLVIGLLPELNVFAQMERFRPLAAYLGPRLGRPVQLTMLSRYGNIIDRLRDGEVDGAFLGSFTGALAIAQLHVEPLARPVNLDGTSTYTGLLFVRRASGIHSIADMKGKSLALVERATTAGYVFPLAFVRSQGIPSLEDHFREIFFAGSHDAAIQAVLDGRADVGAAKNTIFQRLRLAAPALDERLTVLAESAPVPSNGLCVKPEVPAADKSRLKSLLLGLDMDPDGRETLAALGALRFLATSADDYQPVRQLTHEAGLRLADYQYHNE
ncbi:MAG: phosphate/phosphite/phosphonate ABC transporter substrate-binding protein [Thermodesulfobacteriota bacterium]